MDISALQFKWRPYPCIVYFNRSSTNGDCCVNLTLGQFSAETDADKGIGKTRKIRSDKTSRLKDMDTQLEATDVYKRPRQRTGQGHYGLIKVT